MNIINEHSQRSIIELKSDSDTQTSHSQYTSGSNSKNCSQKSSGGRRVFETRRIPDNVSIDLGPEMDNKRNRGRTLTPYAQYMNECDMKISELEDFIDKELKKGTR